MTRQQTPVGRLAPSPTGAQHLGNARSFLLAWLSIRSRHGRIIFRMEDIDSPRVKPWAVQQAMDDLAWLGLDWDEGPDVGGQNEPYLQTMRDDQYQTAIDKLLQNDRIYPCTCSRRDIQEAASAPHESVDGPVYPGTCAGWHPGDALPAQGDFCWRFRVSNFPVEFKDKIAGAQSVVPLRTLGDFPITRRTGNAAYQLAVVVDDIAMGVTEVLRGNDLLPSAFRQIELYKALGQSHPQFAHVPLIVGPDGRRLAKRHGDTRLSYFREQGVSPESIVGWAAWSAGLIDNWESIRPHELTESFNVQSIKPEHHVVDQSLYDKLLAS